MKPFASFQQTALKTLLMSALLLLGPLATAQSNNCAGIQDSMQQAQCLCLNAQQDYASTTSAYIATSSANDPYLQSQYQVVPGTGNPSNPITQSCYSITKGVFSSMLTSAGSFLGFDLGKVLNQAGNQAQNSLCQQINNAIMTRASFSCPRVSIPGFPLSCNGNVNVNGNGVQVGGGTTVGGWTTGGTYTGGPVKPYNPGNNGGMFFDPAQQQAQPQPSNPSLLNRINKNLSCWLSGGPNC